MLLEPFEYKPEGSLRELSRDDAIENTDRDFKFSVRSVEVRRVVLPVQDRDDDTEKAAYLWHNSSLPQAMPCPPNDLEFTGRRRRSGAMKG